MQCARWILTLLILLHTSSGCSPEEEASATTARGAPAPAKVSVQSIEQTSLIEERSFLAEARNAESAVLAAGGSGAVRRVDVREGDSVKRGQVLVQLDDGILRARLDEVSAQLSRSEVELEQARRDAARFAALSESGHMPGAEAEQVATRQAALEAAVQGQRAGVQRLREEISQLRIVAPMDGVVARRMVSRGQWLQTGQPAIEVTSESTVEVYVRVPAQILESLGDDAKVRISYASDAVEGSVAGIVGSLDERSRTALLRVVPAEPQPWLREGGAPTVTLRIVRSTGGVVVSTDAIVYGVAGTRVFRVSDGKAEPLPVTVLSQAGDRALVASEGLKLGDVVVVRGNERLRPGQALEVVP